MPTVMHPNAIVEEGVVIGEDCDIRAGAVLRRGVVLGDRVVVHPYAVIGGEPQDLGFDPRIESGVRIGSGTTVREYVTVNRSTRAGGATVVGEQCFLMASSHVAHDCVVGDRVVIANAVLLAGHVHVGDHSFLGGASVYHQSSRIGEGVIVSGGSRISMDLPPFLMVAERNEVIGFNLVGLRRRGVPREAVGELKESFRAVYGTPGNIRQVAAGLLARARTAEAKAFLEFFSRGNRSIARPSRTITDGDPGES